VSIREGPPLRLSVNIETPDGRNYRWAEDDPDPRNAPMGVSFSSSAVGGFDSFTCTLPRKTQVEYRDLQRLSTVTIRGSGGHIAWQGRIESLPRVSGEVLSVTPGAVGWQAHLDDNKGASGVYIDQDLSGWQPMSAGRKLELYDSGSYDVLQDGSSSADEETGLPDLRLTASGPWVTGVRSEIWYDAGPANKLDTIYAEWVARSPISTANGYFARAAAYSGDTGTDLEAGADWLAIGATGTLAEIFATPKRYGSIALWRLTANTADGDRELRATKVVVLGQQNLTMRGTLGDNPGYLASDLIEDIVAEWAPRLTTTADSIDPSSFIIPQFAFKDFTTASEMIREANRFHLYDWAVWEGPTFHYHAPRQYGKKWRARIAPAQLEEAGPSVESLFNGVIVRYNDPSGTARTVGPGGSGANVETDDLSDDDDLLLANQLGVKRWEILDMGGMSTASGATEVGRRFLEESKLLNASGRARLEGWVTDDAGVKHPAWKVRGGDTISFIDAADTSERKIVKADYNHDSRVCSVDLDAPPEGLDELLQRLQVVLVPLGLA
jgi:hypothetical protein